MVEKEKMKIEGMELPKKTSGKKSADLLESVFKEFAEERGYETSVSSTSRIKLGHEEVESSRKLKIENISDRNRPPYTDFAVKVSVEIDFDEKYKKIKFLESDLNKDESFELAEKVYDQFD